MAFGARPQRAVVWPALRLDHRVGAQCFPGHSALSSSMADHLHWSNEVKSAGLETACLRTRGRGWTSSGLASFFEEKRATQSHQARPEEAQGTSWGPAKWALLFLQARAQAAARVGLSRRAEQRPVANDKDDVRITHGAHAPRMPGDRLVEPYLGAVAVPL